MAIVRLAWGVAWAATCRTARWAMPFQASTAAGLPACAPAEGWASAGVSSVASAKRHTINRLIDMKSSLGFEPAGRARRSETSDHAQASCSARRSLHPHPARACVSFDSGITP